MNVLYINIYIASVCLENSSTVYGNHQAISNIEKREFYKPLTQKCGRIIQYI